MTAAVKFCGITRHEDIVIVNEVRPDYIGFVFAKKSRRYITPEKARRLRYGRDPGTGALDPGIRTVGVFVMSPRKMWPYSLMTVRRTRRSYTDARTKSI